MSRLTSIRLSALTDGQLDTLAARFNTTKSDIIGIAIDRMYQQEHKPMSTRDEYLDVVETYDLSPSGMIDLRLAHIDADWFVYRFDMNAAQITKGDSFARHSPAGVRYLFDPMTEQEARQEFQRRIAEWER